MNVEIRNVKTMRKSARAVLAAVMMSFMVAPGGVGAQASEPIPVRITALGTGLPFLMFTAWKEQGFDKKHGFDLQVEKIGNLTGQWIAVRTGSADLVMGNFLDLIRQHKAGLKIQAFQFGYNFDNPIVAAMGKPINNLSDLKGLSVGVTRSTSLPVLLLRVAGKKAYGIDLVQEAKISEASPSLLPQMLRNGQLDAAYSIRSLVFDDLSQNKVKEVVNLNQILNDAGWNTALTVYAVSDAWREKHGPAATRKLAAALADLNQTLRTGNAGWDAYARQANVDPKYREQFRETFRKALVPNYGPKNLDTMQQIIDALVGTVGEKIVGVTKVDPSAFDFKSM